MAETLAFSSKAVVSLVRQCSLTFKERFGMREKLLASLSLQSGPTSDQINGFPLLNTVWTS